jgi:hypothetical protein
MPLTNAEIDVRETAGVIDEIDLLTRFVRVHVAGGMIDFDIASDCVVMLHGERVKLRLLQPGDPVRVGFTQDAERRLARILWAAS